MKSIIQIVSRNNHFAIIAKDFFDPNTYIFKHLIIIIKKLIPRSKLTCTSKKILTEHMSDFIS